LASEILEVNISLTHKGEVKHLGININEVSYDTSTLYNTLAITLTIIIAALYATWW